MSDNNLIKSIVSSQCPHCNESIYIESQFQAATVGSVFTKEEMDKAKDECISRVATLEIDEEKKESVIKWLKDDSTIFAPTEVESIILSLTTQ